ncbi:MAG: 5-formyltetrahydrofolate cyclo-ligase [Caulobacteraceae bacterium]
MTDSPPPSAKPALRAAQRRRRRALALANPDAATLAAALLPLDRLPPFRVVAGYHPLGSEIDPRPLLARLALAGAAIALPAAAGREGPLIFRAAGSPAAFVPDALGILAPPPAAPALIPDLIVAPLLAFDRAGGRLGQGGGLYDRAIAALRAAGPLFVIGLAFAGQEVDAVPREPHDEALDAILTEKGYIEV